MKIGLTKSLIVGVTHLLLAHAGAAILSNAGHWRIPDPLLWGTLKPGPYAVGFKSSFQFDYARQYDADYVTNPSAPPISKPRPILVDVWYPAKKTAAMPMKYRDYLDVASADARISSFSRRLAYNFREVVSEESVGAVPAKASLAEKAAFKRLLETNTFASKNVPAAKGRFPVVIYHPGLNGTPEDNSVLFEYLASHGYVVISSVYQEPDAYSVHCGGGDIPCSFRDMEFLSRYARGLAFADADKLGAMGHSFGAWAVFAWSSEPDSSVRAFVSLDSGLEYDSVENSGVESLQQQMKRNRNNIRAASLRFASTERKADFSYLEPYLKFGPGYGASVDGLKHNDYLTHGAIRPALLPGKWPDASHVRRTSYDRICNHVLYFLDATLSRLPAATKALERSARGEGLDSRFTLQYKPPTPAPPSARQMSLYVRQHGVEKAVELMRSLGEDSGSLTSAAHVLLQDGDIPTTLAIVNRIKADHPNMLQAHALLGEALAIKGDRQGALAAFRRAQEIMTVDKKDASFWKYVVEDGLKELGQSTAPNGK